MSFKFDPVVEPEVCLELDETKQQFSKILSYDLVTSRKNEIILHGPEGAGKTHLLRYIRKTFLQSQMSSGYVDLRGSGTTYDLYRTLIHSFQDELLLGKLLGQIAATKDPVLAAHLTDDRRFSLVSKATEFDPGLLFKWLLGEISQIKGTFLPHNGTPENMRLTIASLLRAFYFLNEKKYPILFLDHLEAIAQRSYTGMTLRSDAAEIIRDVFGRSSFFTAINDDCLDVFTRTYQPNALKYDYFSIVPLEQPEISIYLRELRQTVVRLEKLPEKLPERLGDETLTRDTCPFTAECEACLKELPSLHPGTLAILLDKALKKCLTQKTRAITRSVLVDILEDEMPGVLLYCKKCKSTSPFVNVAFSSMTCNECGSRCDDLLPHFLRRITLDTSAIASSGATMLLDVKPLRKTPFVFIPVVVDAELSAWEKRSEMRLQKRNADLEYRKLRLAAKQGRIYLREQVGRKALVEEVAMASRIGSIDAIILETAKANETSVLTKDAGMAMEAFKLRIPVLLLK